MPLQEEGAPHEVVGSEVSWGDRGGGGGGTTILNNWQEKATSHSQNGFLSEGNGSAWALL